MANPSTPSGPMATCSAACPVHTDTREYVEKISRGDYEGALEVLLEVNPFPSVCGRICHHPCESECRRKEIDAPISLRMLKRFVVENTREYRARRRHQPEASKGKRVAIIGSGPSGLTAARDLALMGYAVTVFEKGNHLGGMLAHAIPKYRLPEDALREDIDDILATGIEVRLNTEVGEDVKFDELRRDFDAILIAIGLAESNSVPIPGINSEGVLLGIPFLWDVANGQPPKLGDRVLVVGGGNVAMDVARTARRLSGSKVFMACLESRAEMPAWKWEIEEAEEEGIEILNSWGPMAILEKDGKVTGIQFKRCTRVFDENRRFSPQFDENETVVIDVDQVIFTIGQRANLECVSGSPVSVSGGRLICDRNSMTTSERGVFSCGEVMTGPGSAIQAVSTGHDAAKSVDYFLRTGDILRLPQRRVETIGSLPLRVASKAKKIERREVELMDAAERTRSFSPIEPGFTEPEALAESRRCLACARGAVLESTEACAGCLTCARICPYGVATVDRTASMPSQECLTCGLCAAECPAAAIGLARFATNRMGERLRSIMAKTDPARVARPFVVSYCCLNETTSREYLREQTEAEIEQTGILRVMVPCVGRLGQLDLVSPFELGADRVVVISCREGNCSNVGAEELLQRRADQVRKFLDEIGVGGSSLQLHATRGSAEESWPGIWESAKRAEDTQAAV